MVKVHVQLTPEMARAIDRFIAEEKPPKSRAEAVAALTVASLVGLGFMRGRNNDDPGSEGDKHV